MIVKPIGKDVYRVYNDSDVDQVIPGTKFVLKAGVVTIIEIPEIKQDKPKSSKYKTEIETSYK
jgi:hypothetical protein